MSSPRGHLPPQKHPLILLVEDSQADLGLVLEALKAHDVQCELIVITNGERAIAYLDEIAAAMHPCPTLLIVDLNLPRRDGKDVLAHLRMSPVCGGLPVIVLTSSDNQRDVEETAVFTPLHYLRKPIALQEFLALGAVFKDAVARLA